MFTGGTDPICESDKLVEGLRSGILWAYYSGTFSDVGEKVLEGGEGTRKSALFSFSLCQNTAVLLYSFLSLCQNYFWLQRRKCLLCGLVHWSHAVFPPSKSTVLSPKWFAYFPCNTRLKKDQRKSRGKGEPLLLYVDLHVVSCSASSKKVTTTPPSITASVNSKLIMDVMF